MTGISKDFSEMEYKLKCRKCNGTGITKQICVDCKGTRKIDLLEHGNMVQCIHCYGDGYVHRICIKCNGSGIIDWIQDIIKE